MTYEDIIRWRMIDSLVYCGRALEKNEGDSKLLADEIVYDEWVYKYAHLGINEGFISYAKEALEEWLGE